MSGVISHRIFRILWALAIIVELCNYFPPIEQAELNSRTASFILYLLCFHF